MYCWSLIFKLKVPCMPITCFIFSLFPLNAIFSVHSLDHVYTHYHPNWGSKCTHQQLKNVHILLKNLLLRPIFQDDGHFYANCLFYILSFCLNCLIFQFLNRDIGTQIAILTGIENGRISSLIKYSSLKYKA